MPISDPSSATSSNAQAIAGLLLQALAEGSASSTLISTIGVEKMRAHLEACMPYEIERPFKRYLVIKDTETNQIISYVTWALPHSAAELNSEAKEFQEKISKLREEGKLPQRPEGMNTELGKVFGEKVGAMRDRVLGQESRPHYLCENLATDPNHRKRGAARKLMSWPFEDADKEVVDCYLDTDLDGPAFSMYKKLGFVACEEPVTFDLGSYGGTGIHTHVGLLRKPREVSMS